MKRPYHPQIGPSPLRKEPRRSGHLSPSLRAWVYERDGGACLDCGTTERLTLDHIVPCVVGGSDMASNLETRCGSCNSRRKRQWEREHGEHFYEIKPWGHALVGVR